ncbi:MAG TPA: hypothetical protein VGU20_03225 [Stellaceae bacterium]|nr:hypothetical protein [Stellaceae bacterium]
MLGFSLTKLVLLAVVIAALWLGFRYMSRVDAIRRSLRGELSRRRASGATPAKDVEDLVKCARCGAYVAARNASACGRPDCPWGR